MKLLVISTDKKIFDNRSAVALRQIEYAKKYQEMHIVIFSDRNYTENTLGNNIWIYPTRSSSKWLYVLDALKLGRFIARRRGITHITCQDPFETGLVGALIKNREKSGDGKPLELELQIHTDIGSPYFKNFTFLNKVRIIISKYTFIRADKVRVVSNRIKEYVSKYFDEEKIEVRPIAVDTEKIKNAEIRVDLHKKYTQFSKIILMASRLEKEKNISLAFHSFKFVLEKIPQALLVVVGEGSEMEMLKNLAEKLGIKDSIIFEGWQSDLDIMSSYYKTCDCFLFTSYYEGYGMALVEAKAAGAKIVSTDVGVAREIGAKIVEFEPKSVSNGIIEEII